MPEQLPDLLSALVSDIFGANEWLMGSLAGAGLGAAIKRLLRRRMDQAGEILLDEVRRGEKTLRASEVEEAVAVLLRYGRAATEGSARLNLRLMAKVIAGQAHQGVLYADQFLRCADVLAGLTREEIIFLGTVHRHWHATDVVALEQGRRQQSTRARARLELIPVPFRDAGDFYATAEAVTRTGLLRTADGVEDDFMLFQPTRLMDDLHSMAPFEAAIRDEPV